MTTTTKNPKLIAVVAAFAAFIATFNETFLNVAFSPIMEDFGITVSSVQWLATALMLGAAVMVPVSAFAYRSLPTRPLFVGTVGLLVIGSLIGALAPTFPILLVGRIVQALGTGLLIPIGMNITLEVAPREKLGTYMGAMGAMTTLGPSSSVLISGLLLSTFSWRSLLWVYLGLALACLLLGAFLLRDVATLTHPRLDVASVIMVSFGFVGIFYGISTAFSGSLPIAAGAIIIGGVFLTLFVRRQGTLEQPLIDLRPLTSKAFSIGVLINVATLLIMFAMNIIIPMFMQDVLGMPSLTAALVLFPAIALSCVLSPIAGKLSDKHGPMGLLLTGFALITVFTITLSILISTAPVWVLALAYMPVIGGCALIIGPVQGFALSKLAPELAPHGVTIMSTGFQIAGCLGSSLITGIYAGVTLSGITTGAEVTVAASAGFLGAGLVTAGFAIVGIALALWLRSASTKVAQAPMPESHLAQIMKTDVYALAPTDRVGDALKLLVDKGISGAPIVEDDGNLIGFMSDGDVMRYLADQHPAFKNAWSVLVESGNNHFDEVLQQVMDLPVTTLATRHVISVDVNTDFGEVCRVLADHHLRKIPVTHEGRMIGIVNRSNISRYAVATYAKTHGLE